MPILDRLCGLETEYAVRHRTGRHRLDNDGVYRRLTAAIAQRLRCQPGQRSIGDQVFVQNGGAFYYEFLPWRPDGGLVEGATPECRSPAQLLLYQRAQDRLLEWALEHGDSDTGLLKSARDAQGHTFGPQENYEATIASGPALWLYRLGLLLFIPWAIVATLLAYALVMPVAILVLALMVLMVPLAVIGGGSEVFRHSPLGRIFSDDSRELEIFLMRSLYGIALPLTVIMGSPYSLWVHLFGFRAYRRGAEAFFCSRSVIGGAGSVDDDLCYRLAQKARSMTCMTRHLLTPRAHAVFDTGNLAKVLFGALEGIPDPSMLRSLFNEKQRMQIGLGDSNMCETAEYLRVGTTMLVLDLVDAGLLRDAPRLAHPVRALRAIAGDPTLEVRVALKGGKTISALQLQRFYVDRAATMVRDAPEASLEARRVVELWDEVLTLLEQSRWDRLVGRLDWITKRYLIERVGAGESPRTAATVDLRYHELRDGYFRELEATGIVERWTDEAQIEQAIETPPADTPAFLRGRLIREVSDLDGRVRISWASARIGGAIGAKVIRFERRDR